MARVINACYSTMCGPWQWGVNDCCTAACLTFEMLYGVNPMAPLLGTYNSKLGAYRTINSYGGWDKMTETLANHAGLIEVSGVEAGDLGLVKTPTGFLALAIYTELGGWAGKTERGFVVGPFTATKVWRCPNSAPLLA